MSAAMKNIIEIKNIVKKFGDFAALDGVDLDVKEGEIVRARTTAMIKSFAEIVKTMR